MADIATLGIDVAAPNLNRVKTDLDAMSGAAARAQKTTEGLTQTTAGASGAAAGAAKSYASQGAAAGSASRQIELMSRAANQNSSAVASGTSQLRLMSMQLSQVGQQTQVTGNFLQALAIQLPDLALGFGPIGIAAGVAAGAALTFFSTIVGGTEDTAAALKKQEDLVRSIAERWGAAIDPLNEYVAALDRAKTVADIQAGTQIAAAPEWDKVADAVSKFNDEYAGFVNLLQTASAQPDSGLNALGVAFERFQDKVIAGTATVEDFARVRDAATKAAATSGSSDLADFGDALDILSGKVDGPLKKLAELMALSGQAVMLDPSTWRYKAPLFENDNIQNPGFMTPEIGPVPGARPSDVDTNKNRGIRVSRAEKTDPFANAIRASEDRTKAMQAETAAQASLNPLVNDYGYSLAKAKASADLLAAAEKAKKAITPELNAQIERTASALAEATEQQNRQTEAIQKAKQQMEFVKSTAAGFINNLRDGLKNGEGFWKSFGNAAMGVLDRITDKLLDDVLDAVFKVSDAGSGSSGGGIFGFLGSLFTGGSSASGASKPSWLNSGFDTGISKYASGTMSARSGVALVGEKGPELVRFRGGEQVVPSHQTMSAANHNAGGVVTSQASSASDIRVTGDFRTYVDENGNWQAKVENISASVSKSTVNQYDKDKATLYQNGQAA